MTAVALTDENVLAGAPRFRRLCAATRSVSGEPIKPIIGCDFGIDMEHEGRIVLIALNGEGLQQLMHLSSYACRKGIDRPKPMTRELLERHADNLLLLTGGVDGALPALARHGSSESAHEFLTWAERIYGTGRVFVELVRDGPPPADGHQEPLVALAREHGLQAVATNDTLYPTRDDARAHAVLQCIRDSRHYADGEGPGERYLKHGRQVADLFPDVPEAIENTARIAAMVNSELKPSGNFFAMPPLPEAVPDAGHYLREVTYAGLGERYGEVEAGILHRVELELDYIITNGFAGQILTYRAIVSFARERGIRVGPGRGRAPGSIVLYALGITGLDPLRHGLISEAFFNPKHVCVPDIDIEIAAGRRGEVVEFLRSHFGPERVAAIGVFRTRKARHAIRDVGAAIGMTDQEVESVVSHVPREIGVTVRSALQSNPELLDLAAKDPQHRLLLDVATHIEGLICDVSAHAAGTAICGEAIEGRVPTFRPADEPVRVTQYGADSLGEVGVTQVDILSLRDLSVISRAAELVRVHDPQFTAAGIPLGDPATLGLFSDGRTLGICQFESAGMRRFLNRMKPVCFEDLCALNALYRPGRMQLIDRLLEARAHGQAAPEFQPPFAHVLRETHGLFVYQEQVLQVIVEVAGLPMTTADLMRRDLRRSHADVADTWRASFLAAAARNGYTDDAAALIFDRLQDVSRHGSWKAHVASCCTVAFQGAYLKANYPREFFAGLLAAHIENPDRLREYAEDAAAGGVPVRLAEELAGAGSVELDEDGILVR